MKKINFIFILFSVLAVAQKKYQYVIVPENFNFFTSANQYGTNALTHSFFKTEGFDVFYNTQELPSSLAYNQCQALFVEAKDESKLFSTKIKIQIKDCKNKILIESNVGSSREKEYKLAYTEAFRNALTSLKGKLNFEYQDIQQTTINKQAETPILAVETSKDVKSVPNGELLFALPIENGYKLVDSEPNVIYVIKKSSQPDVFIATKGNSNGIFFKKANNWYFDYYLNGQQISESVNVKF